MQQRRMRKRNKKQPTENALIKKENDWNRAQSQVKMYLSISFSSEYGFYFTEFWGKQPRSEKERKKDVIATICNLLYVQSNFHLLKLHGRLATTNKDDNANQKLKRRERRKEKHQEETATHVVCAFLFGFIEVCRSNRTTIVHFFLDFFFIFELW